MRARLTRRPDSRRSLTLGLLVCMVFVGLYYASTLNAYTGAWQFTDDDPSKILNQGSNEASLLNSQLVIVLGMHHSMTSVATKLLVDTDKFYAGEQHELIIRRDNRMKYWEHRKAVRVDQSYFERTRWRHNDRSSSTYGWIGYGVRVDRSSPMTRELASAAKRITADLLRRTPLDKITIIKDPRMSLTASVWLDSAGAKTKTVCAILVRDPLESVYRFLADYNKDHNFLTAKQWASVWEKYTWEAIRSCATRKVPLILVRHEDFSADPSSATSKLANQLIEAFGNGTPNATLDSSKIPADWSEKHAKKMEAWNRILPELPLQLNDILSQKGMNLWERIKQGKIHEAIEYVLAETPPDWVPIEYSQDKAYWVLMKDSVSDANLKVLHRSLTAFDASQRLILAGTEAKVWGLNGWEKTTCTKREDCSEIVSEIVEIDPESFVLGRREDGSLVVELCPNGQCEHSNMFQAFKQIGGRTSDA